MIFTFIKNWVNEYYNIITIVFSRGKEYRESILTFFIISTSNRIVSIGINDKFDEW